MKVMVTMKVDARFICEVDVPDSNPESIKAAAEYLFQEADCGVLSDIDGEVISWEDESENLHDINVIGG